MELTVEIKATKKTVKNNHSFIDLYNEATEDYEFWSKDYNMHFGYYTPFRTKLFRRDTMLNEMNNQVLKRLEVKAKDLLVDLGCGMGGTMLYAAKKYESIKAIGVTLSDFQVKEGNHRLKDYNPLIVKEDYTNTSFVSGVADGVYAIESLCHCGHSIASLKEAYRILKPEGKFVMTDAFLKKKESKLCQGGKFTYKKLCEGWDLKGLGNIKEVVKDMETIGFKHVKVEDVSFRVAPSVLHVPFAILGFVVRNFLKGKPLKPQSLNNLKGSFYALLSGIQMNSFGYYIITAEK